MQDDRIDDEQREKDEIRQRGDGPQEDVGRRLFGAEVPIPRLERQPVEREQKDETDRCGMANEAVGYANVEQAMERRQDSPEPEHEGAGPHRSHQRRET